MNGDRPTATGAPPPDRRLPPSAYSRVAFVLRAGLLGSLVLLIGGVMGYLWQHPSTSAQGVLSTNPISGFLTPSGLGGGIARAAPEAFLTLGILVLVATPIFRVAAGVYYFHRGGERTLAEVTFVVLVLLLFALLVFGPLVK